MSPTLLTIIAVLAVSAIAFIGILLFLMSETIVKRWLLYFVSFSTGALLGDVFIHIIPEIAEKEGFLTTGLLIVLLGIVLSFVMEKMIHWRHCHHIDCENHKAPLGMMNLFGDAVHNFIDGALIAGSFLVSVPVGIATTVAVALHEIPQEIGDFAILLYSGYTKKRALLLNFLTALAALLGAAIVILSSNSLPLIGSYLLPLAAGNFVYIAGADLIPELHKETRLKQAAIQLLCMIAGILVMYGLTLV
jgi:zinc and cadmium transporter